MFRLLTLILCIILPLAAVEKTEALPNPLTLKSNWWEYLDVDQDLYEQRAGELKQELNQMLEELEGEQKDQAGAFVKKITSNLDSLFQTKLEEVSEPPPKPYLNEYTLLQQIDVAKQLAQYRQGIENEKKEISILKKRIAKLSSHLDKSLVGYRDLQDNTHPKLLAGLEIINTRLSLQSAREKLRLSEGKLEVLDKQLKRSEEEIKFARANTNFSTIDSTKIDEDIQKAKIELENARSQALHSELRTQENFGDTPKGRLRSSVQQLTELNYSIKEASAETALLGLEMQRAIAEVFENDNELGVEQFEQQVANWQTALGTFSQQTKEWKNKNEDELSRLENISTEDGGVDRELQTLQSQRIRLVQDNRDVLGQLEGKMFTTSVVLSQLGDLLKNKKPPVSRVWDSTVQYITGCCRNIFDWYNYPLFKIGETPVTTSNLLKALLVLALAYVLSSWIRKLLTRGFSERGTISKGFAYSINRLVHYVIMFLGTIWALTTLGLDFDRIYWVLGALSVGIGFGLQNIVNNFVSGLIILFSRNIAVGDYVELANGSWGSVLAINVMNTIIRTWDGLEIIVPNSKLVTDLFTNWTRRDPYKRQHIPFGVAYGSDKEKVEQAALKAASRVSATVGAAEGVKDPQCWLVGFGDSALDFELVVWTHVFRAGTHGSIKSSYFWELDTALKEAGIEVPFPIREIRMTKPE